MAAPTGTEKEIYRDPVKGPSRIIVEIEVGGQVADTNFEDTFAGTVLDSDLWSSFTPPDTQVTVSGGTLTLEGTASTNGAAQVWSKEGKAFPFDKSIGWTIELDNISFPTITGFGTFARVSSLQEDAAILAIKCNEADGYTVEMPEGTIIVDEGTAHTDAHSYSLAYTPATNIANATYVLSEGGTAQGTIDATNRQAWFISLGNSSIQAGKGNWTTLKLTRVDVNLDSVETPDWPVWTDREQVGSEWWGRVPYVTKFSLPSHKRADLDVAVLTVPQGGFVTGIPGDIHGPGYRANLFAGYRFLNRKVRIKTSQSDGRGRFTSWKEQIRGLCSEPQVRVADGQAFLDLSIREEFRRRAQYAHPIIGFSDAGSAITGLVMNKNWYDTIDYIFTFVGLAAADFNISVTGNITPRTWQLMGESALDNVGQLVQQGAAHIYRNAGQTNPSRIEVAEPAWGNETPDYNLSPDSDIISLDWVASTSGMVAQVVVTVQHSEFGEFTDVFPRNPMPAAGRVKRLNAAIAQDAGDINSTRLLPFLQWKLANRELNGITVNLWGQDWIEHDLQIKVNDRRVLKIDDQYWLVDGWAYNWDAIRGLRTTLHLVNQHPERNIMLASMGQTISQSY